MADVIGAVARLEDGERPIVVFVDYDFLVAARPCTRSSLCRVLGVGDKQLERAVYLAVSADAVNAVRDSVVVDPCTPLSGRRAPCSRTQGYTGVLYGATRHQPGVDRRADLRHHVRGSARDTAGDHHDAGGHDRQWAHRRGRRFPAVEQQNRGVLHRAGVHLRGPRGGFYAVSVGVAVGDEKWDLVAGGGDRAVVFAGTVLVRGAKLLEMLNQLAEKNAPDPFEVAHAAHLMDLSRRSDDVERRKALLLAAGVVWTTTFICASSKYACRGPSAAWVVRIAVSTGRSMFSLDAAAVDQQRGAKSPATPAVPSQ